MSADKPRVRPVRAKSLLQLLGRKGARLIVLKSGKILFVSREPGVKPLLELTALFPSGLNGATVVDRIVGTCAGSIFIHLRVKEVIARTMSAHAALRLREAQIPFYYETLVAEISNRTGTGICPFEQLARQCTQPEMLIARMREKIKMGEQSPPIKSNKHLSPQF
ncbi:MAG: DUF1893 domain-containing protein [candidate division WOR-3 bacterium]|jgi:hypothetical protein